MRKPKTCGEPIRRRWLTAPAESNLSIIQPRYRQEYKEVSGGCWVPVFAITPGGWNLPSWGSETKYPCTDLPEFLNQGNQELNSKMFLFTLLWLSWLVNRVNQSLLAIKLWLNWFNIEQLEKKCGKHRITTQEICLKIIEKYKFFELILKSSMYFLLKCSYFYKC